MQTLISQLFDLHGEIAVVIGGTGALGGAMASALAGAGAATVIVGRHRERGEQRAQEIRSVGGQASFVVADATDPASLREAADRIAGDMGDVTILVNAAGGNRAEATLKPGDDFCQLPLDAWNSVFDLNLVAGAVIPCQVFAPTMIRLQRGSIINVASLAGLSPLSRVVAYSAAKAAVLNLTTFLAREWAPYHIRVNAISPGFFPAEQNRSLLVNSDGQWTERGRAIIDHTPMGRFGESEELAGAIVWLAAHRASSFVTGQNIVIDGGFSTVTI